MNGIVSGIERSGTSLMMQILEAGGVPVAYNGSRPADYHNPKGYYELEGGKIIRSLMEGSFPLSSYEGVFIKVTAYGLKFLPPGRYQVIYMERNIEEVLDSTQKMDLALKREEAKPLQEKLNRVCKQILEARDDIVYLIVNYNSILTNPLLEFSRIDAFLGGHLDVDKAVTCVDDKLYRNRRN